MIITKEKIISGSIVTALVVLVISNLYIFKIFIDINKPLEKPAISQSYQVKSINKNIDKMQQSIDKNKEIIFKIKEKTDSYKVLMNATNWNMHQVIKVFTEANKYEINNSIFWSLIDTETGGTFKTDLKHLNDNGTTDFGPCQINNGGTAQWIWKQLYPDEKYDESKLLEFDRNIEMGCWYLSYLNDKYDDQNKSLIAYNGVVSRSTYAKRVNSSKFNKILKDWSKKYEND